MNAKLIAAVAALAVSGCTTRPLVVDCADFRSAYVEPVLKSPVIEAIQADARGDERPPAPAGQLFRDEQINAVLMRDLLSTLSVSPAVQGDTEARSTNLPLGSSGQPVVLLLSGGGQWGAFGASYMRSLADKSPTGLPTFTTVTGVSTGALQALFVGANQVDPRGGNAFLKELTGHYRPERESDVVDRGSFASSLFKGSVAQLEPLRRKIEATLCPPVAGGPLECPIIRALATPGAPVVLVGFVEASSGDMLYANITKIARDAVAEASDASLKHGQQCITGAVLASAAIPFYYQQVQVRSMRDGKTSAITYYDGGVRQSVFFAQEIQKAQAVAVLLARGELRTMAGTEKSGGGGDGKVTIYAIRNGPTVAKPEPGIDDPSGAVSSALRGYSLLVNQSEVASLETVRLRRPGDLMFVATADRYNKAFDDPGVPGEGIPPESARVCVRKDEDAMFEPQFMQCLQALGRATAHHTERPDGWISMP